MLTYEEAMTLNVFYHDTARYKSGTHGAYQARRNGKTQTWKRTPGKFSIPVKIGWRECARIESRWNADEWLPVDPTDHEMCAAFAGLRDDAPWAAVYDKLLDMDRPDIAEAYRSAQGATVMGGVNDTRTGDAR